MTVLSTLSNVENAVFLQSFLYQFIFIKSVFRKNTAYTAQPCWLREKIQHKIQHKYSIYSTDCQFTDVFAQVLQQNNNFLFFCRYLCPAQIKQNQQHKQQHIADAEKQKRRKTAA